MHNGGITDFPRIKRKLQESLSDEIFEVVQGNTGQLVFMLRRSGLRSVLISLGEDSEWAFALLLSKVGVCTWAIER